MSAKPDIIDQSPEARTPPGSDSRPVSAFTIMKVVDMTLRFPNAKPSEMAAMCGVNRHLIPRAINTPMAQARLDSAYDVRSIIADKLKSQALNAFEVISKVQLRAMEQLEDDDKVPDAALLAAATRISLETLKGVGLLKDHSIEETRPIDTQGVSNLLDRAAELRDRLEEKLQGKVDAEVVVVEGDIDDAQ